MSVFGVHEVNGPQPPVDMVMPATPQLVFTLTWAVLALGFAAYSVYRVVSRRDFLLAILLCGGALTYVNEPLMDLLGVLWHPRIGQWIAVDTFVAAPLWGVFVYMVFFGAAPYLLLCGLRRGMTGAQIWMSIGAVLVLDLTVEIPALHMGMYVYYGDPAMQIAGFPLYWFAINIGGPLETAAVLFAYPHLRRGRALLSVLLFPVLLDAASSVSTGLPAFSTLWAQASMPVKYLGALVTIALGYATVRLTLSFIARHRADEVAADPAGHRPAGAPGRQEAPVG